jgi:hypothetical protein
MKNVKPLSASPADVVVIIVLAIIFVRSIIWIAALAGIDLGIDSTGGVAE